MPAGRPATSVLPAYSERSGSSHSPQHPVLQWLDGTHMGPDVRPLDVIGLSEYRFGTDWSWHGAVLWQCRCTHVNGRVCRKMAVMAKPNRWTYHNSLGRLHFVLCAFRQSACSLHLHPRGLIRAGAGYCGHHCFIHTWYRDRWRPAWRGLWRRPCT